MTNKIRFIESSYSAERSFHYSTFFSSIQLHLINRLELLLEYKICQAINKNYTVPGSPTGLKPSDWMQRLIEEVFRPIARFKSRSNSQSAPKAANDIQNKIEQLYIRKFNLFLIKIFDLTLRRQRKSIEPLRESLQFYMTWVAGQYGTHVNANNFPNYFLEILEQNYVHFEGGRFEAGNRLEGNNRYVNSGLNVGLNGGLNNGLNESQFDSRHFTKSPAPGRSLIRGNRIAPQSVYESGSFESASFTNEPSGFRTVQFKSDVGQRLRIVNGNSCLKMFFCFDNT